MNDENTYDQKKYISGVYSRAASDFGVDEPISAIADFFGKRLVELIGIPENSNVLDIAAGRGASLFPTINKVGQQGSVIGIDLADNMVKETMNDIVKRGYSNAKMIKMDAENLEFGDNIFDIILCCLSIFFFPHYEIALNEAFRVLKPYGRIGISTFSRGSQASMGWQNALNAKYLGMEHIKKEEFSNLLKMVKSFQRPEFTRAKGMQKILTQTGFKDVHSEIVEKEFIYTNAEEWWQLLWATGTRIFLEKISSDNLVKLKGETFENFDKYSLEDGLHQTVKVLFTSGVK